MNPAGVAGARMLARYNAWANRLIYDAVAALPPGEAVKERATLFKNMVHTLNHNYVIGLIWQAHLEGRDHGFSARNTKDHPPLSDLRKAQEGVDRWYLDWTAALSLFGSAEILLHVVNHTTYHRGFVADMFYQVPAKPPTTDLPVFLREERG